jgi:hypothetical protein
MTCCTQFRLRSGRLRFGIFRSVVRINAERGERRLGGNECHATALFVRAASSTCSASSAPTANRKGCYHVHNPIEKYGRKGNVVKSKELLNGDCPKRDG